MLDEIKTVQDPTEEAAELPLTAADFAKKLGITLPGEETPEADTTDAEPDAEPEAEPEPDAEEAEVAEPAEAPEKSAVPAPERMIPESQVQRLIVDRLARATKAKTVQEYEALEGKPLEEIVAERRKAKVAEYADQTGMSEAEAKRIVENEEKVRLLEARVAANEAEQARLGQLTTYQQEKQEHIARPLVRRHEAEIDTFARQANCNFVTAMIAVLGQKAADGTLGEEIKRSTQQRVLADVGKRQAVAAESGSAQAAPAAERPLSAAEKQYADFLRVPRKAYAANKPQ